MQDHDHRFSARQRLIIILALFFGLGVMAMAATPTPGEDVTGQGDTSASPPVRSYRVILDAPSDVDDFLETYLELFRSEKRKDLTEDDLYLLVDRCPDNASALLKTLGYFDAKTEAKASKDDDGDWVVVVNVNPGEPVRVGEVRIQITGALSEDEEAMKRLESAKRWLWRLPVGAIFTQSGWDDSKQRLLNYVASRHYATATLKHSEAKINIEQHAATLLVQIDSGPSYVFGTVTVFGFDRYPESIVTNRLLLHEGEPYRQSELRNLQTDLQGLPYFNGVIVEGKPTSEAPYTVPVSVQVEEAPRNKLDLSLGYSTNKGPRVLSQYAFYNVANRGWIFDSILDLSRDTRTGELGLTFPRHRSGYDHRVYASYGSDDTQGWKSNTEKIGATRAKSEDGIDRLYSLEHVREKRHDNWGIENHLKATAVGVRWSKNTTVPRNNPRRGYLIQGEAQVAVRGVLTDESFVRLYARGTQFLPVGQRSVLLGRLEVGQTFSNHPDKVPTQFLFRAGGSGSVRGYDYQSMGIPNHDSVIPGRVLATASLEYQQALFSEWRAAVFVDYGDAANRWVDWEGKTGVGVGARWLSPVGTLGTDVAYGIDDRKWRFYFSLGMSF